MGKIVATLGRGLYPLQDVYDPADTVNGVHLYKMLTSNKVYCAQGVLPCRLPDDGHKMVECYQCKEWYHTSCVKIPCRTL